MKNVIITGATSFISLKIIENLLEKNYYVYAIVRRKSTKIGLFPKSDNLKIIELDMNEYKFLNKYIDGACDYFLSFAWDGTRGIDRENIALQMNNYKYSMDAIECIINTGCKKVILAGSQAEYGEYNTTIKEDFECNPISLYGKMKLKLYNDLYKKIGKDIQLIEARFFSLYGPFDYSGSLIMTTLHNMINNYDCKFTKCTQRWDYLHVDDAACGLIDLLESDSKSGVYNFGSGKSRILKEYINEMYLITKSKSNLFFGELDYLCGISVNLDPDITKLVKATNWKPRIAFDDGIKDIILRLESNKI